MTEIQNTQNANFGQVWSETERTFSENLARRILNFEKMQKLKIQSVLDICSGSGDLLSILANEGKICTGTEINDNFLDYCLKKYSNIKFFKTKDILDIENLGQYDLITCNHDVLNLLSKFSDWASLFKKVYNHLTNGGIFIFDYYSLHKLVDWNEIIFNENKEIDVLKSIVTNENQTTITTNFYTSINYENSSNEIRKQKLTIKEQKYSFQNEMVFNSLKSAKFRYMILIDSSFHPISDGQNIDRVRIIAIKRENVVQK